MATRRRKKSPAGRSFPGGVAVVTDSTASLSAADAEREGIVVVPLQVVVGAESFTEGVDASPEIIAAALKEYVPVSTSRPNPDEFVEVYRRLADEGAESIVSVHLSSRMSGTLDSALLAAKESPIPVSVVDSRQVGLATGFAAGQAAGARGKGVTAEEVAEIAASPARGPPPSSTSTRSTTCAAADAWVPQRRCSARRWRSSPC